MSKKIHPNDEVIFVKHMKQVIKNGMLGRGEDVVLGSAPTRRFFSGVLFPDYESFSSQVNQKGESDPQPQYRSLAKNCNLGLEFLVRPDEEGKINLLIGATFKLYPRLIPTFSEQDAFFSVLEARQNVSSMIEPVETENEESIDLADDESEEREPDQLSELDVNKLATTEEEAVEELAALEIADKGVTLFEKYRAFPITVEPFQISIDVEGGSQSWEESIQPFIQQAVDDMSQWQNLFSVTQQSIEKTGAVPLETRPSNNESYEASLAKIKSPHINLPRWDAKINVEVRPYRDFDGERVYRVVVSIINKTYVPNNELKEKPTGHPLEFFDVSLKVQCNSGLHKAYDFDGAPRDYKYDKRYSVKGINCVGLSRKEDQDILFESEAVPDFFQPLYRTKEELKAYFEDLMNPDSTVPKLTDILTAMQSYLTGWKTYINQMGDSEQPLQNESEREQCQLECDEFEAEIRSFELGLYVLSQNRDKRLLHAFNLMNRVFLNAGKGKYNSWRLFQIIFIVRLLPSLFTREVLETDPYYDEIIESAQYADVLWFPTGGGKTEAYLGLIVTGLFFDRLRGKKRGCSAWVRFPLRMLSKNQLDRLAKIIVYAEEVREMTPECRGKATPFSIGYFAGSGNTPNFVTDKLKKSILSSEAIKQKTMILHRCPYCDGKVNFDFDEHQWRILHRCTNADCFVFQSPTLHGVLPLYITDSEVYRFIPSVICGTVDKLAILGRYREFSHLFGQIGGICSKHGFYSDSCIVGRYDEFNSCNENVATADKVATQEAQASFYDPIPSFLIQDELHLLKEELGVLNGHYEGVLNELARSLGRKSFHIPKIVAATATIESYEHHIKHLYLRKPRKYPSMGYKKGESFYATSTPHIERRLYMGVLSHSKSQDEVIGRALYLYQKEIYRLYEQASTVWSSFGFQSIKDDTSFLTLLAQYDLSVVYVNQKTMAHDIRRRILETIRPGLMQELGQEFDLDIEILLGENEMGKIVEVIDRIESEGVVHSISDYRKKLHALIATSLISHGVDLDRINAFFMAGMPSKQAEYIQASSRSSRSHAGLVFVSFRPNDLRERSQYQFFNQNHMFMERLVDPVPINRMSIKAIQRSMPGILAGLLFNLHSQNHSKTIFSAPEYRSYIAKKNANGRAIQLEIIEQLQRIIIGTDRTVFPLTAIEKAERFISTYFYELENRLNGASGKLKDEDVLNPITSFRDIEAGIPLNSGRETARVLGVSDLF
ncbi:helicase-related protein [Cohnella hongkongensis]|uniref:Helicase-related protein n=1 Tax=Cohnella hongkongensis TaxID=178337 RepID=A0ABV9FMK5_9BACL